VEHESAQTELSRLRREQAKTRTDEVFGGLTPAERFSYDRKQNRIRELELRLSEQDLRQSNSGFAV
jgi:hypothetical protein